MGQVAMRQILRKLIWIKPVWIRPNWMERGRRLQRRQLCGSQLAPGPFGQVSQAQGADGDALQIPHRMTQQGCGAPDLAVAALVHHQLQPGVLRALPQPAQPQGLAGDPIERHAAPPGSQHLGRGLAGHPHPIGLGVAVAGVGELQGEAAIVAEQQSATAVAVETPDRVQAHSLAQLRGQQVEHGGTAPGIVAAAQHADRLVEQQRQRGVGWAQWPAIHQDLVASEIGPIAEAGGPSVHTHATSPQQVFGAPPGAEARGGDQLLQAFGGQGWRRHQGQRGQRHSPVPAPRGGTRKTVVPFRNLQVS